VIGVFADDLLQAEAIGVLRAFFVEVDKDRGSCGIARLVAGNLFDLEAAGAVAGPLVGFLFACLTRKDLHLISDHEGGIEADAELADEIGVLALIAGELREKVFGAGAGDGS
jgi:hypothetical protein